MNAEEWEFAELFGGNMQNFTHQWSL